MTLRSTAIRHRTRLFHTVVKATLMWWLECVCVCANHAKRHTTYAQHWNHHVVTDCLDLTPCGWFYIRRGRAAWEKNAALGHEMWDSVAIKRQVVFASHVARLAGTRLVKVVLWGNSLPAWSTLQFLVGQRRRGEPAPAQRQRRASLRLGAGAEQFVRARFGVMDAIRAGSDQDASRLVLGALPANWWEGAQYCVSWAAMTQTVS